MIYNINQFFQGGVTMFKKRLLALATAMTMMVSLAACGGEPAPSGEAKGTDSKAQTDAKGSEDTGSAGEEESGGIDTSEFVTIKVLFIGDQQKDAKLIYDAVNEKLKEKCNAQIEVEMIPWSDWETRIPLIMSAQEDYDLIPMNSTFGYYDYAPDGVFYEISDEVLQKYMPMTWENQDHLHFEQNSISGKCYIVPVNAPSFTFGNAIALRTDLLEKYNLDMPSTWDDLEKYFDAIKANEPEMMPMALSTSEFLDDYLYFERYGMNRVSGLRDLFAFHYDGADVKAEDVILVQDDPNYVETLHKMKSWADKGYWSKNANVNTTSMRDAFESGMSGVLIQNLGTSALASLTINNAGTDRKADIVNLNMDTPRAYNIPDGGLSVPIWSENWERALMVLDYLKFDMDIYQTLRYGLEGVHWEKEGDNRWSPLDQSGYVFGNGNSWQIKNEFPPYEMDRSDQLDSYVTLLETWRSKLLPAPNLFKFTFDSSNVATEMANLNNVISKYKPLLHCGLVDDVDATLAEYRKALDTAGLEKVRTELETQLKAFLAQ